MNTVAITDDRRVSITVLGPVHDQDRGVRDLVNRAHRRRIPLSLLDGPPSGQFLLVRPDQHIADRSGYAADLDLELATGHGSRPSPARSAD